MLKYASVKNNGLVLMAFYTEAYFMITRCFKYFEYIFVALAFCSMIVYALAVLNSFYIDPLGMFTLLTDRCFVPEYPEVHPKGLQTTALK